IEQQSNALDGGLPLWQAYGDKAIKVNPMYPAMATGEIDAAFDLPFTRLPHPRYKGKEIPAYTMIRHSVNLHRGCFGGCAFCTISAHQGKFISSRSKESIMREARQVTRMPDFKGYISDLGGPSANMYRMGGKDKSICSRCKRPSCLHPAVCPNLDTDHRPLLDIYREVDALPGVKKSFVGSGVRYDLSMHRTGDKEVDSANRRYNEELIANHVSGRLKVAPEHTEDAVLEVMRKPSFDLFREFNRVFDAVNRRNGLRQQLIPYFISSHPGCREIDMAELAVKTKELDFHLEQVQDFTPTPMTVATEIYYSGVHPYTGKQIFTATRPEQKLAQRKYFFWYDRKYRIDIERSLHRLHRPDLITKLFSRPNKSHHVSG
ncbi:MAG: radical SAM protein, partial [Muribaculaceae bacterium]|nr:radical SAM protein [Muribaculaceae bacterium]